MIRNWYAVYTSPNKERKVSSILTKKGIECFCPVISVEAVRSANKKSLLKPLFNSFVFVQVAESEIPMLKTVSWIINLIYWRSKPAVISNKEIDIIKKLTANYSNIRIEKSFVDQNAAVSILDEPTIAYNENSVSVKYKSIKVNLPSLGYTMIAERIKQKEKAVYHETSLLASFPRRINAFFFN
jgi:transcription antitermination factor NusG